MINMNFEQIEKDLVKKHRRRSAPSLRPLSAGRPKSSITSTGSNSKTLKPSQIRANSQLELENAKLKSSLNAFWSLIQPGKTLNNTDEFVEAISQLEKELKDDFDKKETKEKFTNMLNSYLTNKASKEKSNITTTGSNSLTPYWTPMKTSQQVAFTIKSRSRIESESWTRTELLQFLEENRLNRFLNLFNPLISRRKNVIEVESTNFRCVNETSLILVQGELDYLIDLLVIPDKAPLKSIWNYDDYFYNFLLVFPLFLTPFEFLQKLIDRWKSVKPSADGRDLVTKFSILNVMKEWLRMPRTLDFIDKNTFDLFLKFLTSPITFDTNSRATFASIPNINSPSMTKRKLSTSTKQTTPDIKLIQNFDADVSDCYKQFSLGGRTDVSILADQLETILMARHRPPPTKSSVLPYGDYPQSYIPDKQKFNILDVHPVELARQLTLIESQLFNNLTREELLYGDWYKNQDRFSHSSPNLYAILQYGRHISSWIVTEILKVGHTKDRVSLISNLIVTLENLMEMKNFNSLRNILLALRNPTLSKLKKTWENLAIEDTKKLMSYYEMIVGSGSKGYRNMIEQLERTNTTNNNSNISYIPAIGIILDDLYHVNQLFQDDGKSIQWQKMDLIAGCIYGIVRYSHAHAQFNFMAVESIQKLIKDSEVWLNEDICSHIAYLREVSENLRSKTNIQRYSETENLWQQSMTEKDWNTLHSQAQVVTYKKNSTILKKGQSNQEIFIIKSTASRVAVVTSGKATPSTSTSSEGKKDEDSSTLLLTLGNNADRILYTGDIFGEISVILKDSVTADVIAMTDVELYKLSSQTLQDIYSNDPKLYWIFSLFIARKLATSLENISNFHFMERKKSRRLESKNNLELLKKNSQGYHHQRNRVSNPNINAISSDQFTPPTPPRHHRRNSYQDASCAASQLELNIPLSDNSDQTKPQNTEPKNETEDNKSTVDSSVVTSSTSTTSNLSTTNTTPTTISVTPQTSNDSIVQEGSKINSIDYVRKVGLSRPILNTAPRSSLLPESLNKPHLTTNDVNNNNASNDGLGGSADNGVGALKCAEEVTSTPKRKSTESGLLLKQPGDTVPKRKSADGGLGSSGHHTSTSTTTTARRKLSDNGKSEELSTTNDNAYVKRKSNDQRVTRTQFEDSSEKKPDVDLQSFDEFVDSNTTDEIANQSNATSSTGSLISEETNDVTSSTADGPKLARTKTKRRSKSVMKQIRASVSFGHSPDKLLFINSTSSYNVNPVSNPPTSNSSTTNLTATNAQSPQSSVIDKSLNKFNDVKEKISKIRIRKQTGKQSTSSSPSTPEKSQGKLSGEFKKVIERRKTSHHSRSASAVDKKSIIGPKSGTSFSSSVSSQKSKKTRSFSSSSKKGSKSVSTTGSLHERNSASASLPSHGSGNIPNLLRWSCSLLEHSTNKGLCGAKGFLYISAAELHFSCYSFGFKTREIVPFRLIKYLDIDLENKRLSITTKTYKLCFGLFVGKISKTFEVIKDTYEKHRVSESKSDDSSVEQTPKEPTNTTQTDEISIRDWELVLRGSTQVKYKKGDCILKQDTPNRSIFQVTSGRVCVVKQEHVLSRINSLNTNGNTTSVQSNTTTDTTTKEGGENEPKILILDSSISSDINGVFGEISFLTNGVVTASVIADEDSIVDHIESYYLNILVQVYPEIGGLFNVYIPHIKYSFI
eukprot:TRINITY_DN3154_c0_g2_i3.p1 TRINITY_DN3154_c0_g2~~TRINITY_DN3154_c0_g2_i3.p1  ORF type:complete len:1680 (-),score=333.99 TRINITY_DN3154_c0_g2_i3:12-5051(-)